MAGGTLVTLVGRALGGAPSGGAGGAGGGGDFELRVLEVNARTTMTHYARAAKRRFPRAKRFEVCARTPTYLPTHLLTYVLT